MSRRFSPRFALALSFLAAVSALSVRAGADPAPPPDAPDGVPLYPAIPLFETGPNANRVNFVFMGDGFTAADMPIFAAKVDEIVAGIFEHEPLRSYRSYFNLYRMDILSNESGLTDCASSKSPVDTEFGIIVHRVVGTTSPYALCLPPEGRAKAIQYASQIPDSNAVVWIVVNCNAGCIGEEIGRVNLLPLDADAAVLTHVMGHAAGLSDEPPPGVAGPQPDWPPEEDFAEANISRYNATDMLSLGVKWADWFGPADQSFDGPVSAYPYTVYVPIETRGHGGFCFLNRRPPDPDPPKPIHVEPLGIYYPSLNSAMGTPGRPFNPPSAEAVILSMHSPNSSIGSVRVIDATSVVPNPLFRTDDVEVFPVRPLDHILAAQWYLDDEPIPGATGFFFTLDSVFLSEGQHTLSVEVWDDTTWVRDEESRDTHMTQRIDWPVFSHPIACQTIFTTQPRNCVVRPGETARFSVQTDAIGGCMLDYRWRRDKTILLDSGRVSGAFTPNLAIAEITPADDGAVFYSEVWNGLYHIESHRVVLRVAPCLGDTNDDLRVDFVDLNTLLGEYGRDPHLLEPFRADYNVDDRVDFLDLNILLGAYGDVCAR